MASSVTNSLSLFIFFPNIQQTDGNLEDVTMDSSGNWWARESSRPTVLVNVPSELSIRIFDYTSVVLLRPKERITFERRCETQVFLGECKFHFLSPGLHQDDCGFC